MVRIDAPENPDSEHGSLIQKSAKILPSNRLCINQKRGLEKLLTKHLAEGIATDYDSDGRLAWLEILRAQKRFGGTETIRRVELERLESTTTLLAPGGMPSKKHGV